MKNYFTTSELGEILGISRIAVFKKIKTGEIKAEKNGRNFVIARENLPGISRADLNQEKKDLVREAVKKTIAEYGETLKQLGKE